MIPGDQARVTVTHRGFAALRHGQAVAAFIRSIGLWWGDQLGVYRTLKG